MLRANRQYNKNANMMLFSGSVAKEPLSVGTHLYPSIISVRVKEKRAALWKLEMRHCSHDRSIEQEKIIFLCLFSHYQLLSPADCNNNGSIFLLLLCDST